MAGPKKMYILYIYEILFRYSDENHTLSQKQIEDYLFTDYGVKAERKSIRRNLADLAEFSDAINYTETPRISSNGETDLMLSDWYLEHDFTESELQLLIDGVQFSRHIPIRQCRDMIKKIEALGGNCFKTNADSVLSARQDLLPVKDLFSNIDMLSEAIKTNKQVTFQYSQFGLDKKLHPAMDGDVPRTYLINPYKIVAANSKYYLICNMDKYDNLSQYRLDRIDNITILEDSRRKPFEQLKGHHNGLDLPKHMAEHVYMFTGESAQVRFEADKNKLSDIFDWFGPDICFSNETSSSVTVSVKVNVQAMRYWALQYVNHVKVLSPPELVDLITHDLQEAAQKYSK